MPYGIGIFAGDCPNRAIRLEFSASEPSGFQNKGAIRMQCRVLEAVDCPPHIFMYLQRAYDPYTQQTPIEFQYVASPYDLSVYPVEAPDISLDFPYFRKSEFDILLPSSLLMDQVRTGVVDAVTALLDSLCRMDQMEVTQDIWIPAAPTDASESESLSP